MFRNNAWNLIREANRDFYSSISALAFRGKLHQLLLGCHFLKVLWENRAGSSRQKHQTSPVVCCETINMGFLFPMKGHLLWTKKKKKKKQVGEESLNHLGSCADQRYRGLCTCRRGRAWLTVSRAVTKEASGCPGKQKAQKGICRVAALALRLT